MLREAYADKSAVTDELVEAILAPGREPGAVRVFLDFISYSSGPLVEDLLPALDPVRCPVLVAWGEADPWEPVDQGRTLYAGFPAVERFVVLPGVGHCPQDEAPGVVNELLAAFVGRHSQRGGGPAAPSGR